MIETVGVEFKDGGRIYYFSPNGIKTNKNVNVIVETERGLQYGKVVTEVNTVPAEKLNFVLKNIVRLTTKKDYLDNKKNIEDAKAALDKCNELASKYNLDMRVTDASFTFDRTQLMIHFVADNRVDFRNLAKDLANIYKTRIELRQIGVRDKAREVGGMGSCGRGLCCSKFMYDFDSISINMAKNQGIALNPSKINGVCGRLMCCLKYEDEVYKEIKKGMPKVGQFVKVNNNEGKVISIDVINQKYRVLIKDEVVEVKLNES